MSLRKRFHTAPEVAAAVADEIRTKGHFQGGSDDITAKACLLANDAFAQTTQRGWHDYCTAVGAEIDATVADGGFANWNDTHPTAEVLAVLDKIAESETPNV